MRIGIDARKLHDFGIGTYIRGLMHAMAGAHRFVALGDADALRAEFGESVEAVPFDAPLYSINELVTTLKVLPSVDVFHEPHYTLPFGVAPSVVTIHDLIHLERRGLRYAHQRAYARWMIGSALRRASQVITVSRATADALRSRFEIRRPLHVIPNGIDAAFFERVDETAVNTVRARWNAERYLLYVGNDLPHKNLDRLTAAFEQAAVPGLQLLLAGNVNPLRAQGNVIVTGRVTQDDLRALYAGAEALVLLSEQEGFGLPAAEAMAAGTPVIVSDIAALREITAGAAVAVSPLDSDAIAATIRRVARERALREDLAQRGRETAARYRWSRAAEATLEVYAAAAKRTER